MLFITGFDYYFLSCSGVLGDFLPPLEVKEGLDRRQEGMTLKGAAWGPCGPFVPPALHPTPSERAQETGALIWSWLCDQL